LATEEMIRWATPVKEFMRTAAADTTVRGVPIAAGESVLLSYVSANRDEDVFSDPFRFDVGRDPNKHLAFGYGVHFCLGAALARMEVNSFFAELLPRLKSIELTGNPEFVATTFVGGLKHLPVRYDCSKSRPSASQLMAVSMPGASAIDCPNASTTAISRSRRVPGSDDIGAGGIRLLKAAASKSFPLEKWRYRVARATLAPRVTASTVTALGPPERSSAVAASSKRALERAGRGSILSVM
jgi:hypothetical protein